MFAIHHDNKAGFFPIKKLFHHHTVTGIAECVASQHVFYGSFRFFLRHGDNDAFTCSKTIGFDNNGRTFLANIGQGRLNFCEVLVFPLSGYDGAPENLW